MRKLAEREGAVKWLDVLAKVRSKPVLVERVAYVACVGAGLGGHCHVLCATTWPHPLYSKCVSQEPKSPRAGLEISL